MSFWRLGRLPRAHARARIGGFALRAVLFACAYACAGAAFAAPPDVTGALTSGRLKTRLDAAQAVIEHRAVADVLVLNAAAAGDPSPEARARMLMAAYAVDIGSATPALIAALRGDSSPLVRSIAGQMLSRCAASDAVRQALLDSVSRESDPDVRRVAVFGLSAHPHPDSQKALAAAAKDRDPEIRRRAGLALARHPRTPERDRVLDALENDADGGVSAGVHAARKSAAGGPR